MSSRVKAGAEADEALVKARAGNLAKARSVSRDLKKIPPNHPVLMELAAAAHRLGDPALALRFLGRAAEGDNPDAQYGLGVVLSGLGRLAEAEAAFARCLQAAPVHIPALTNLGGLHQMTGAMADAEACYRRAAEADPSAALAFHNLAGLYFMQGRYPEAEEAARRAFALDPGAETALRLTSILGETKRAAESEALLRPIVSRDPGDPRLWRALGNALKDLRRTAEALAAYRRALDLDPANGETRHMIAILTGENTAGAPADYVRGLFDAYADRFEDHLVGCVGYDAPARLHELFVQVAGPVRLGTVLDLGCGTGLTAEAFRDRVDRFIGVDLSPRMLQVAARRGLYAELREADAATALAGCRELSAVVSTDTFIYVGDLAAIFHGVAGALAPGGWFLFSVEAEDAGTFTLRPSGRYAQSPQYIRALLQRNGLEEVACVRQKVRGSSEGDIAGDYWVVRAPA